MSMTARTKLRFRLMQPRSPFVFFFFNDTATTEIYTLSLHDALPISTSLRTPGLLLRGRGTSRRNTRSGRSEEHTSELQSRQYLVCRLLLEKKGNTSNQSTPCV